MEQQCYVNLQEDVAAGSPCSIISQIDYKDDREKAEQVLVILTSILCVPHCTSILFLRKFELISGWNVLKTVLPGCWSSNVNELAFDVLLGRLLPNGERCAASEDYPVISGRTPSDATQQF
ncbi:hypothetical protein BDP27DRAFT_1428288 [Rhodocollybia butyracea]|uniref:Uncharacterized protein n=1 Tax=Rhodocollybia butyracea TaxID=206335 RepID=A0A9P5PAQ5_9AGAR|nr:hypothetical protein BDP27DRAFT_1428288 [Rhodocollybia butyracea]